MTAYPIPFRADELRALLNGRKTQTRRVVKPQPFNGEPAEQVYARFRKDGTLAPDESLSDLINEAFASGDVDVACPYGQPGGLLWVREKFIVHFRQNHPTDRSAVIYAAKKYDHEHQYDGPWKRSIHMPRWASRITLKLTHVRVERVQDISEDDAKAEGTAPVLDPLNRPYSQDGQSVAHRLAFKDLWDSINAKRGYGWEINPWVWALTFEIYRCNIDSFQGEPD